MLPLSQACCYLGISRQAYYQWLNRQADKKDKEQQILSGIMRIRCQQPCIGARKLQYLLSQEQQTIGRDKLFDLLRANLLLVLPKRAYYKTTQSHHRFHCHPNLLPIMPNRPEQDWVADITYLPLQKGNGYLSLVTDKYSRKIVGYQVDDNMMEIAVTKAYTMALKQRFLWSTLIHHSDRGFYNTVQRNINGFIINIM